MDLQCEQGILEEINEEVNYWARYWVKCITGSVVVWFLRGIARVKDADDDNLFEYCQGIEIAGLSDLQRGIIDILSEDEDITDPDLSGRLANRGIVSPRTGIGYTREHINKVKNGLRDLGYLE